jgi:transcriptional regulator
MQDKDWLRCHVAELTEKQEMSQTRPWAITDAPESFVEMMLRGIVGFRIAITRLEGKWKMSQNRDRADRDGVIKGLERRAQGDDLVMAGISSRIRGQQD